MRKDDPTWLGILKLVVPRERTVVALVVIFAIVGLALALAGCGRLQVTFDGEIPDVALGRAAATGASRPFELSSTTQQALPCPDQRMSGSSEQVCPEKQCSEGCLK